MENLQDLQKQVEEAYTAFQTDVKKFEAGNSTAGTRARQSLQTLSVLAKSGRKLISEIKAERKESK